MSNKFRVGDKVTIKQPTSIYYGQEMIITEVDYRDEEWPYFCKVQGKSRWFQEEHLELSKKDPWEGLTDEEQECLLDSLEFTLEGCEYMQEFERSEDRAKYVELLKQLITKLKGE